MSALATRRVPSKTPMPERATATCEDCMWQTPVGAAAVARYCQDHAHNYPGHRAVFTLSAYYRIAPAGRR
jgi:hypothetical protein